MNKDHYNNLPMPPSMIVLLGGVLSVLIVYPVNFAAIRAMGSLPALIITVPVEEMAKVIGLVFLLVRSPKILKSKTQGVKLGGLAGLAFGLCETVISRSGVLGMILSTPLHILCSGLVGIGLVFSAGQRKEQDEISLSTVINQETLLFLLIAIGLHFMYNFLAFTLREVGLIIGFSGTVAVFLLLYNSLPSEADAMSGTSVFGLLSNAFRAGPSSLKREPRKINFCSECGSRTKEGSLFCHRCGKKLETEEQEKK